MSAPVSINARIGLFCTNALCVCVPVLCIEQKGKRNGGKGKENSYKFVNEKLLLLFRTIKVVKVCGNMSVSVIKKGKKEKCR